MNRHEFRNGTNVTNTSDLPQGDTILGVQGVPDEIWYQEELQKHHFGYNTPQVFHGYHTDSLPFPFWSSEAYTFASTLVSLASYLNID